MVLSYSRPPSGNVNACRETLLDFFRDFSDFASEFLVYDDGLRSRTYTYREVANLAQAFAFRLRASGLRKDDSKIRSSS